MDRYIAEISHSKSLQLPSQAEVTYTHDILNTVSVTIAVITAVSALFLSAKRKLAGASIILNKEKKSSSIDLEIAGLLTRILTLSSASRATIALLHGKPSYSIPELRSLNAFKYYSIVWEETDAGASPTKELYLNTLISDVSDVFSEAMAHDEDFVVFSKDTVKNEKLLYRMSAIGNGIVLFRLMGSEEEGFFGIFTIQFSEAKFYRGEGELSESILHKINEYFIVVEEKARLLKDLKLNNTRTYLSN